VPDEDFVLDCHAVTDERMARYLAPFADLGILLNLDEGPDFCVITDLAALEVDEFRELHVLPQLDIRRYAEMAVSLPRAAI
jgi:hypothetical protein